MRTTHRNTCCIVYYLCSPRHNTVHIMYIYAAHDDAVGSSLAPDKVAAATDEVRSKYEATGFSTGTSEVPYPTTGTYLHKS